MALNVFVEGTTVEVTVPFTVDGVATNPTAVTFYVIDPADAETDWIYGTDAQVTRPSTGTYKLEYQATAPGAYEVRAVGTGTVKAVVEGRFRITDSNFSTA